MLRLEFLLGGIAFGECYHVPNGCAWRGWSHRGSCLWMIRVWVWIGMVFAVVFEVFFVGTWIAHGVGLTLFGPASAPVGCLMRWRRRLRHAVPSIALRGSTTGIGHDFERDAGMVSEGWEKEAVEI